MTWPDVAKGLCILLVVLHHLVGKQLELVAPAELAPVVAAWQGLSTALKPIRMPLFFAISGLFAASAVHRPWRQVARRVLGSYYLYVVWLVIFAGIYSLETTMPANRTNDLHDFAGELLFAATSMWFLYALAVYFVLVKLLRRAPVALVLSLGAALTLSTSWLGLDETNRVAVLSHFVFFAVGALCPDVVRRLGAAGLSLRTLLAAYVALTALTTLLSLPGSVELGILSVVGVPLGITVAVRLSSTRAADRLAWLGQRTLRVYVLHMAVIAVLVHLPVGFAFLTASGSVLSVVLAAPLVALYPVVACLAIAGICLGVHQLLVRAGAGFLFELPALPAVPALRVPPVDPARRWVSHVRQTRPIALQERLLVSVR